MRASAPGGSPGRVAARGQNSRGALRRPRPAVQPDGMRRAHGRGAPRRLRAGGRACRARRAPGGRACGAGRAGGGRAPRAALSCAQTTALASLFSDLMICVGLAPPSPRAAPRGARPPIGGPRWPGTPRAPAPGAARGARRRAPHAEMRAGPQRGAGAAAGPLARFPNP